MNKRNVELVVISDVHLGTYGCHATELLNYLQSINPKTLVLNGDIIDAWQFSKRYFPASHMQVIKQIFEILTAGTKVYYLTGNHDEMLRKFSEFQIGNLVLDDKVLLELDGKKAWIFHGDVFDSSTTGSAKFIAKLGGKGYDLLIVMNRITNFFLEKLGKEKMSFSKKIKNSVKKAVSFIDNFETTASEIAIQNGYDYVICGHIHQPQVRDVNTDKGNVRYLNSGDWVENLTSLEYNEGAWNIFRYSDYFDDKIIPMHTLRSVSKQENERRVVNFNAVNK